MTAEDVSWLARAALIADRARAAKALCAHAAGSFSAATLVR
jgi:hypothetical protein